MNITKENIDELNSVITVSIEKNDYEENAEKVLRDYRKKVNLDGFRAGKVPMGMVRKMYGKSVLVEEINKLISEALSGFISENQLNVIGEPLPNKDQKPVDFDHQSDFEFKFDVGIAPDFEIKLTKRDKIPFYQIQIEDKMIDNYVENYTKRFGKVETTDKIEENSLVKGSVQQIDKEGNIVKNGLSHDDVMFSMERLQQVKIKKAFTNKKIGDTVDFDVKKAFENDTEIAAFLKLKKEEVAEINPNFRFTVNEMSNYIDAEINQELFDKVFGEGKIKSVEEFRNAIKDDIAKTLVRESEFKFFLDAKEKLVNKTNLELPEEFLKRWLSSTKEGSELTEEKMKDEFPLFLEDLKWQLIKSKVITENELNVTEEEVLSLSKEVALQQFAQYGLSNVPDEQLEGYAREMLKKDDDRKRLYEKKLEDKVVEYIKENVKVDEKEISSEEFSKLFSAK